MSVRATSSTLFKEKPFLILCCIALSAVFHTGFLMLSYEISPSPSTEKTIEPLNIKLITKEIQFVQTQEQNTTKNKVEKEVNSGTQEEVSQAKSHNEPEREIQVKPETQLPTTSIVSKPTKEIRTTFKEWLNNQDSKELESQASDRENKIETFSNSFKQDITPRPKSFETKFNSRGDLSVKTKLFGKDVCYKIENLENRGFSQIDESFLFSLPLSDVRNPLGCNKPKIDLSINR